MEQRYLFFQAGAVKTRESSIYVDSEGNCRRNGQQSGEDCTCLDSGRGGGVRYEWDDVKDDGKEKEKRI